MTMLDTKGGGAGGSTGDYQQNSAPQRNASAPQQGYAPQPASPSAGPDYGSPQGGADYLDDDIPF